MSGGDNDIDRNRGPSLRLVSDRSAELLERTDERPESFSTNELPVDSERAASEVSSEEVSPGLDQREQNLRILEAVLFSSSISLHAAKLADHLPPGEDPLPLLMELQQRYQDHGVNLVRVAGRWAFRTAEDLGYLLKREVVEERRLSKAALETLSIIAYHQPVTRAEIEEIRGVSTSAGTLDILLETEWIRPRGRRRAPGRPVTYGTTEHFLEHFGLDGVADLPGLSELRGAGLLTSQLPADFVVPQPSDVAALMPDELPLEDDEDQDELDLEPDDAVDDDVEDVDASFDIADSENDADDLTAAPELPNSHK
ncbi:MAG: SMC-Scp complex subunit ScpB [Filomicrobium sp.]